MKVVLITSRSLNIYAKKNSQSRIALKNWMNKVQHANWNTPHSIKESFSSADFLGKGTERVVFNIGGNQYRMICRYHFGKFRVFLYVKWIGSHDAYSRICRSGKQYDVTIIHSK